MRTGCVWVRTTESTLMKQSTKSVIITGVSGFIGSHTAKAFKEAGYYVLGVDLNKHYNENYVDEFVCGDFLFCVSNLVRKHCPDAVLHIAGTSLVSPSYKNPGEYYHNNVGKTNIMLQSLHDLGWHGTIVFSSSAAVYGTNYVDPWQEGDLKQPISPYGWSKFMAEQVLHDQTVAHGFKTIALRYFNASGCDPEGNLGNVIGDTHLIPRIIENKLRGTKLTINGKDFNTPDGTCIRDYLHVTDIADAHLKAVTLTNSLDLGTFRAYNLGTGRGYSNLEVVNEVERVAGKVDYVFGDGLSVDPDKLIANANKFISDTNWAPKYSDLSTIVSTTWEWMKRLNYE